MSNSSSCVLPSVIDRSSSIDSMVHQQSDPSHYHYHHHSDSSRSSSFGSASLSPTMTLTSSNVHRTTSTTALNDIDPILSQQVEYELGLSKRNGTVASGTRKNAWGNLSYAELISKAISTSAEQRLTLAEIYDWMIKYVPFFRNKIDRVSSAGWKNSIRHNLSLHNRFKRIQSEGAGKSSWWIINPDEKSSSSTIPTPSTGTKSGGKQGRRSLTNPTKTSTLSSSSPSSNPTKRLKNSRSTKTTRPHSSTSNINSRLQTMNSISEQISPVEISSTNPYETHQWTNHIESDNSVNNVYEQDFYSTSINTPLTNSNGNSTGGIHSTYSFDDGINAYSSSTNTGNSSDYSYHHPHPSAPHPHHHPHHPYSHSLYSHSHNPTSTQHYSINSSTGNFYSTTPSMLNDRIPLETYSSPNVLSYSLGNANVNGQEHGSQTLIDSIDDQQDFLRAQSRSSQSSTSLSPPIHHTSSNSTSTPTNRHSSKTSTLSSGYHHSNSNGTLTLYGHHHHHQHHHHHSNIESGLHLTTDDDEQDRDEDDLLTLVHHHEGFIDDYSSLTSTFPSHHHHHPHNPLRNSHHEPSASILRTVLQRSMIDIHNQ